MVDFLAKYVIRIGSGVIIIGAITLLSATMVPVASKHKDPGSCTVAMGSVVGAQQMLLVNGSGLSANTSYLEAQPGVQSLWVTTDTNGSVSDQSLRYNGPGKYTIEFDYYYFQSSKLVQATATSCSANL